MLDLVFSFLGPWGSIGALGVLAAVAGFFVMRIRNSGRDAERARQRRIDAAAVAKRDEIDDAVAGRNPAANRERLGSWSETPGP